MTVSVEDLLALDLLWSQYRDATTPVDQAVALAVFDEAMMAFREALHAALGAQEGPGSCGGSHDYAHFADDELIIMQCRRCGARVEARIPDPL